MSIKRLFTALFHTTLLITAGIIIAIVAGLLEYYYGIDSLMSGLVGGSILTYSAVYLYAARRSNHADR